MEPRSPTGCGFWLAPHPCGSWARREAFERLAGLLAGLQAELMEAVRSGVNDQNMSGNDAGFERHISESNHTIENEVEPPSEKKGREPAAVSINEGGVVSSEEVKSLPLGLVLEACPDIKDFGPAHGIRSERDLADAAQIVRPMLGISPMRGGMRSMRSGFGVQRLPLPASCSGPNTHPNCRGGSLPRGPAPVWRSTVRPPSALRAAICERSPPRRAMAALPMGRC